MSSKSAAFFHNLITVKVFTGKKSYTIAGTLFEGNDIRIVQIGEYRIEVIPSRYMLVSRYYDKPGIIGKVGTILGKNSINIGNMQVGRRKDKGEAIMVLQVDHPVSESLIKEIEESGGIITTRFVEL
jgi:D-3-phosphoglycerate dehydrogenase